MYPKNIPFVVPDDLVENYDTYKALIKANDIDGLTEAFCSCYKKTYSSVIDCTDLDLLSKTFKYSIDFPKLTDLTGSTQWVNTVVTALDRRIAAQFELAGDDEVLQSLFDRGISVDTIACIKTAISVESW
jgi:hypothetical protein